MTESLGSLSIKIPWVIKGLVVLGGIGAAIAGVWGGVELASAGQAIVEHLGIDQGLIGKAGQVFANLKGWQIGMAIGGLGGFLAGAGLPFIGMAPAQKINKWARNRMKSGKTAADKQFPDAFLDVFKEISEGDLKLIKEFIEKDLTPEQINKELTSRVEKANQSV